MLRYLLALTLLLSSLTATAELQLQLDRNGLKPSEVDASQLLLSEARNALPPSWLQRLNRNIEVRWISGLPSTVYGRTGLNDLLELNVELLPALVDGSAANQPSGRSHGNQRQELLATLLHELTHIYDRARLWPAAEQHLFQRCRQQLTSHGGIGQSNACRGQAERRFSLSDDPRLLDLAGWTERAGQRGERSPDNAQYDRSPDDYELSNPREFVAVNLEYFLLDPSYACRRPALQRYFQAHFDWAPMNNVNCPKTYPYLNAGNDLASEPLGQLDPTRVYSVDYLFADANQNWMSRWGHSMLRLVICAPGRPLGPDCRLDLDEHLVLSYRAFVGDLQLSSWAGLSGAYPSRLFVLPLEQVVEEYTKVELRSLNSLPLQLSRTELEQLVEQAALLHWSHDGDYYFLTNNCAVETLKLMRSGTAHPQLRDLDTILPNGLQSLLISRQLVDASVLDDPKEAMRLGYRFDSFRERYQVMFEVLRQHQSIPQEDVEQWLDQPASERQPWIANADLRSSAAMLLLEQAAMRRQVLLAQNELKRTYLDPANAPDNATWDKAGKTLQQVLQLSGFLSRPAELVPKGYGLPQPAETQQLANDSAQRQAQLRQLGASLEADIRLLLSAERISEIEDGEANVKQLSEHLRQLHQRSGGLKL